LAEQLEQEVAEAVRRLIISAKQQGLRDELLATLARVLWHSTVHPNAICGVLEALAATEPGRLKDRGIDFLSHGYLCGYAEWDSYQRLLYKAVRQSLSDEGLHEALACAMRWRRDHYGFTRYARLVKMLKEKVAKRGRLPKMLIFAGYPGVAEDLVQRLRRDFGAESTTEFTSGLSREEKESSVKQFRTNSTTWLLVSDESGGEGRNFQFADALIHFDTPWYVSRVEQRIGRLDRLGREKESHSAVVSEVIFDCTSVESGLVRCYDFGVGVYRRSISGLEFALRDVEARIVMTAIEDGNEGLVGLAKDIAAFSEEERARDESEALLDEASFDRIAAEKFRRIRHSEQNEIAIEEAFTEYLQLIASNRSVRRIADLEHPDGLWLLRSDEIHQSRGTLKNGVVNQATPFMGTFRRAIAQQRLDLHFFNLGNPLFDAIRKLLFDDTVGRTYAVEVKAPSHKPWVGFEFVFCAAPDVTQLTNNVGLLNQARQLFAFQPVHVFCRADDFIEEDTEVLGRIRQSIVKADKERGWWNLTKEKSLVFQDFFTSPNWEELIYRSFDSASKAATSRVSKEVDLAVATTNRQLNERIKQLCNANGEEFEIEQLRRLHKSLNDWRIELDSVGFISINGRLHERTLNARR
jgi:ATP-dependent helicase HepA